jgi:hypothetical protein
MIRLIVRSVCFHLLIVATGGGRSGGCGIRICSTRPDLACIVSA